MPPVELFLLSIAAIFLIGVVGEVVFDRTGVPDVVWLIVTGIVLGPILGVVPREVIAPVAPFFGAVTLLIVLFDGGTRLRIEALRKAAPRAVLLAVTSFVLSGLAAALLSMVAARFGVLPAGWGWLHGVLLGAIVGGSSSIVIMPAMQQARVEPEVSNLVNLESALTDALCVVAASAMIRVHMSGRIDAGNVAGELGRAFGIGIGAGVVAGLGWVLFHRLWSGGRHEYPLTLGGLLFLYIGIEHAGGSAALGVLMAAVIIGNAVPVGRWLRLIEARPLDPSMQHLHGTLTFLIKSFFFTFIGLMIDRPFKLLAAGLVLGLALLVARIPAVLLATAGGALTSKQKRLAIVALPRGMAAGVLATMPAAAGVPGTETLPVIVFACVTTTILVFAVGFSLVRRRGAPQPEPIAAASSAAPPADSVTQTTNGPISAPVQPPDRLS